MMHRLGPIVLLPGKGQTTEDVRELLRLRQIDYEEASISFSRWWRGANRPAVVVGGTAYEGVGEISDALNYYLRC